ncbi:MAG: CoA-binding protein [Patescibacteria group bacterium]|jgi:hypothetical protein
MKKKIAIIGASMDRNKFGNKALRAYRNAGWEVYPVNPSQSVIEGLRAFKSVLDIPVVLDRVSVYLPPEIGVQILNEISQKNAKEIFFNPGTESKEIVEKAEMLGLKILLKCSIIDIGYSPADY